MKTCNGFTTGWRACARRSLLTALMLCAGGGVAHAQTPTLIGPTAVLAFTASPDQTTTFGGQPMLTTYQVEFFTVTGSSCPAPTGTPLVASLGKPTPDATNTIKSGALLPLIVTNTLYCGYVSAVGPGGTSARTNAVGPFGAPKGPGAPTAATLVP